MTFDIDANGILNVSAKDRGTGKEQRITITASSGLDKSEVERLVQDAEVHAEEDRRRKEEIETRNAAESLAYNSEKMLRENKDKIPEDLQNEVNEKDTCSTRCLAGRNRNRNHSHGNERASGSPAEDGKRRLRPAV